MKRTLKVLVLSSTDISTISVGANYMNAYFKDCKELRFQHERLAGVVDLLSIDKSTLVNRLQSFPYASDILLRRFVNSNFYKHQVKEIIKRVERSEFDACIITLNTPESIFFAYDLVSFFRSSQGNTFKRIKFNLCIWDSFDYISSNRRLTNKLHNKLFELYKSVIQLTDSTIVISDGMKEYLQSDVGIQKGLTDNSVHTLPFPITNPPVESRYARDVNTDKINIVFAGSVYCWREWNTFVATLDDMNWIINGRQVYIHVFGRLNLRNLKSRRIKSIIIHEVLPHAELVNHISQYDIAYLPYFTEKSKSVVAKTSLPGKLSLYVEASLPVLYHGPSYSAAAKLIEEYNLGETWSNKDAQILKKVFKMLECSKNRAFEQCYDEVFNLETNVAKLTRALS